MGGVTSFDIKLPRLCRSVCAALCGAVPVEAATRAEEFYLIAILQAPGELKNIAIFWNAPTDEPIPEERRGAML